MKIEKAKNTTSKTRNLVHPTNKPMPKDECVNAYAPFEGKDGRTYEISYPANLNECTNCYAFSLGIRAKGDPRRDYFPGFLSGYPLCFEIANDLEGRVRGDLAALGRTVFEVIYAGDIPAHLPKAESGSVWIKALQSPSKEEGIHFMVKNEASGRWIHKLGWFSPPKVVVRNLEVRSDFEAVLQMYPEYRARLVELGPEGEAFIRGMCGNLYSLASSRLEDEDNGPYWSFPENATELEEYKVLWVMRISE